MNEEWWRMNEGWWFQTVKGFWFMTDGRTDICDCRVALMKDAWRMMKVGGRMNEECCRMRISSCWGVLRTDRQTNEQTFVNVESLSRLKRDGCWLKNNITGNTWYEEVGGCPWFHHWYPLQLLKYIVAENGEEEFLSLFDDHLIHNENLERLFFDHRYPY